MDSSISTIVLTSFLLFGTIGHARASDPAPGSIKMLPGYTHQRLRGIDTVVGKISREDGLTINYDIGESAGNYAEARKKDAAWFKRQVINGQPVHVAFAANKELTVTFTKGPANFFATIKSEEDMADVLLMLSTYIPDQESK